MRITTPAVVVLAGLAATVVWVRSGALDDLDSVTQRIRQRFPQVPQLSTSALANHLEAGSTPLLLDVRTEEEFAVSHLPGARRVAPSGELPDWLVGLPRNTPIVAYCAVGYRSSDYVQRLIEAGFDDVRNLEGSIFAWANEGRPVVRQGAPTDLVHPYDEDWGRLLDADRRAPAAP